MVQSPPDVDRINIHELIEAAGGQSNLARLMGYDPESGRKRVHNWVRAGKLPYEIEFKYARLFRKLIRRYRVKQQGEKS